MSANEYAAWLARMPADEHVEAWRGEGRARGWIDTPDTPATNGLIADAIEGAGRAIEDAILRHGDAVRDAGKEIADAIRDVLSSPNVPDSNGEAANLVDTTHGIARALQAFAEARTAEQPAQPAGRDERRRFDAAVSVSAVLEMEWSIAVAPGGRVRCPLHDAEGELSIAPDDRRAWCNQPRCVAVRPRGADAYALATAARTRQ